MLITIFTPTYNRAYILEQLHDSILSQKECDFEWVVVDDGSSDDTENLVRRWAEEDRERFEIRYFRQENAGKHVAWNKGLQEAHGELFFPVDSDDHLTENAMERIVQMAAKTEGDDFIGFSGTRSFPEGKLTGGTIHNAEKGYIDYLSIDRRSKGISGDLAEVFYTEKLRKYPFPVFADERFVPEAVIFNRFSEDGMKLRGFPFPLYHCEYLPDGYTKNVDKLLIRNWKGYTLYLNELLRSSAGFRAKIIPFCGYLYRWMLKTFRIVR